MNEIVEWYLVVKRPGYIGGGIGWIGVGIPPKNRAGTEFCSHALRTAIEEKEVKVGGCLSRTEVRKGRE